MSGARVLTSERSDIEARGVDISSRLLRDIRAAFSYPFSVAGHHLRGARLGHQRNGAREPWFAAEGPARLLGQASGDENVFNSGCSLLPFGSEALEEDFAFSLNRKYYQSYFYLCILV